MVEAISTVNTLFALVGDPRKGPGQDSWTRIRTLPRFPGFKTELRQVYVAFTVFSAEPRTPAVRECGSAALGAMPHGPMCTGVPTGHHAKTCSASSGRMRTQPRLAFLPMESKSRVG